MLTFLYALHFIVCFILIGVVLLQRGKGQDLGASLGGGSANTIFGSRGAGNFLTKITTASAIIFMGTSLSLSYLGYKSSDARLFDESEPFVPEGAVPKAEESSLEEVPAGGAAGATTDPAAGDAEPGLVEIPAATDATAPPAEGAASDSPSSAPSPADAPPTTAPSDGAAAAPIDANGASAAAASPAPTPAETAKQP